MKHGAPPVINPEGSPFPKLFKNITLSKLYTIEFLSDKKDNYLNISSPDPGFYYAATFLSYSDPKYNKITQQGKALLKFKGSNHNNFIKETLKIIL